MMTTVSFFLNLSFMDWNNSGNIICSLYTIIIGIVSLLFPVFVGVFYSRNYEALRYKWTQFAQ